MGCNLKGNKYFYTKSFKDLINRMLTYRPDQRITIEEVLDHPYLRKGKTATKEEIIKEFTQRNLDLKQDSYK